MKIGYKIIIGSFSLGLLYYPTHKVLNKYSQFKDLQITETNSLLKTFKVRPDNFYTNGAYELAVKSFADKNIKNIQLDLSIPDEPLKVSLSETTASAIDSAVTTSNSIVLEVKPIVKEETSANEVKPKEPEKKVVIEGTPVQDKKVEDLQYYIQLGVFKSLDNANNLLKKVGSGFVIVKSRVNSEQYIVRSNPGSKEEIEILSNKAKKKESSITPIIRIW